MTRSRYWTWLTVLGTCGVAGALVAFADNSDKESSITAAAKALQANSELRANLSTETFKKLKESAEHVQLGDKTYYFVEGDLKLDEDQLLFYAQQLDAQYAKYKAVKLGIETPSAAGAPLMLHVVNGQIMRWDPGTELTYCVLKQTFGPSEYQTVVTNMDSATKNWKQTCNIKFKHIADKDNSTPGAIPPAGVAFTVRKVNDPNGPIASAFFPGDPATDRHLLLFPDYFTTSFDKVGVLRHELGHVLGFRHEHIRSEAPAVCQGEPIFEAIPATDYDPQSVMHYFCGGAGSPQLAITVTDRLGAQMNYGSPIGTLENPPTFPVDAGNEKLKPRFNNLAP